MVAWTSSRRCRQPGAEARLRPPPRAPRPPPHPLPSTLTLLPAPLLPVWVPHSSRKGSMVLWASSPPTWLPAYPVSAAGLPSPLLPRVLTQLSLLTSPISPTSGWSTPLPSPYRRVVAHASASGIVMPSRPPPTMVVSSSTPPTPAPP